MSKMRHKSDWFISPFLLCLSLVLSSSPTCAQRKNQTNLEVQRSRNVASLEPSSCVLRRQEELISCRGINHTQLVEALTKIKLQMDNKRHVVEGRKLEDGIEAKDREVSSEKAASNRTQTVNTTHPSRADIRELTIFSCDLPKLTASSIEVPTHLEILSIVNSGVKEVRPDALSDHAQSLTRLALTHNFLHALPEALKNLTRLEVLDLSHNEIDHLPEGTLLFNLHRLRQLNLDHNKLGQILGAQARLGLRSPGLSLAVFNLEPLRDSLIHLTLAYNALAAFPEQFERPFTRLNSLDLSSNELTEVLPKGFQDMPLLQHLDLSGNRLQEFNPLHLSTSLLDLNLRGNPWACTCDAKWILENLQRNHSESSSIISPTCSSPLHLRHRELVLLKESEICPENETVGNYKVIFVGDDVDGSLKIAFQSLHLLNVSALNHLALIVSWRVDAAFYKIQDTSAPPISWAITLLKTGQDPKSAKVTKMKLERYKEERPDWVPGESLYAELLHGLEAKTQYTLCIVPVQDGYLFTRPDKCRFTSTLEKLEIPTTTATTTTTSPTAANLPTEATTAIRAPEAVSLQSTKDYRVETDRVVMVNEARRVVISWNVTIHPHENTNKRVKRDDIVLQPLGWKITYRQFAKENETDIVLVSRGGEPIQNFTNHYSVEDLEPGTGYTFCLQTLTDLEVQASLKDNGRETFDMASDQHTHSHSHQDPKVIYSTLRGQPEQQTHSSYPVTNSIESEITSENSSFDNPPSGIPSIIPPVPSFRPQSINRGIPANIPPVPNLPSSIPSFDNSLNSPSSQPTDGNFVYTSTGERIPIPSTSSGPSSPFNLPSIVGPRVNLDARQSQWVSSDHPILNIPRNPRERFTYDSEESPVETTTEQTFIDDFTTQSTPSTTKKQRFTYVERRKRSVNDASNTESENPVAPGSFHVCKEVVTQKDDNIIAPVAIASTVSTSTTVIVAIVFCCCCPKKCRRKKSGSGWQGRSVAGNNRKISTISSPTPVNVYTRQTSVASGTTISNISNGDLKGSSSHLIQNGAQVMEGDINGHPMTTGRSVSVTSSTGYLTPLPVTNGNLHDPNRVFSEAKSYLPSQKAYINSVKDRLLQQHKDLNEFHPGYDIPPTSSIKSLLGYDYPHPTPVNPIGAHSDPHKKGEITGKAPIPSPSSSDSNYNASVADPQEAESLRSEINLNIPFSQNKSSDSSKKFNISKDSDLNKSIDYNYINPGDFGNKPRTYIKNAPLKKKHRKYGSPQRLPDERIAQSVDINPESGSQLNSITPSQSASYLSHSVPDLATAGRTSQNVPSISSALQTTDITAAARLNLLIGNQNKDENATSSLPAIRLAGSPKKSPVPSISIEDSREVNGYVNFPASDKKQSKDHYHTWSSSRPNTPRSRPSLGEVVLTGGTLIEVPEGYVVPKPPKPARSVRLLVPGEDRPVILDKTEMKPEKIHVEYIPPPTTARENKSVTIVTPNPTSSFDEDDEKSQITHLMTPELDTSRIVLSTGMAV